MKLIVGLGNPGAEYTDTRHNLGYRVVDRLAERWQIAMSRQRFSAWVGDGSIGGRHVILLKPTAFMNRSGEAVAAASRFYKLALSDLLVISDDLALPVGRIRLRAGGSAGGHKGLADVTDRLGTQAFARLRVGIGQAQDDAVDYVLSPFEANEAPIAQRAEARAADAVETWVAQGIEMAMTKHNNPTETPETSQSSADSTRGPRSPGAKPPRRPPCAPRPSVNRASGGGTDH